jgi:hypothetical protein
MNDEQRTINNRFIVHRLLFIVESGIDLTALSPYDIMNL